MPIGLAGEQCALHPVLTGQIRRRFATSINARPLLRRPSQRERTLSTLMAAPAKPHGLVAALTPAVGGTMPVPGRTLSQTRQPRSKV